MTNKTNAIKLSDLREYLLKDDVNPAEAYFTVNNERYVFIECLKTYMKKD
jgi:hypothetical protein